MPSSWHRARCCFRRRVGRRKPRCEPRAESNSLSFLEALGERRIEDLEGELNLLPGDRERRRDAEDTEAAAHHARHHAELEASARFVCCLHSYANPSHEMRAEELLCGAAPELFVSTSAEVFPHMREFERWTTTTVNAFT
ncbi:MAG: hypothetical protein J2P51_09730, partial [Hyphomicrobiaceae bacterium]|nr:hypothetical protein [Hyphomicrobiaceae bacterium]